MTLRSEFQESFFQSTSEDTDIEEDWKLFKSALKTSVDLSDSVTNKCCL